MRKALSEHYPDVGWSRSEAQPDNRDESADASPYWVYDPIDGAYHYIQGMPLWSSSLALISEGRTVFSIVYEPSLHELFVATESGGATLNGVSLRVSGKSALRSAVVATALPPFGYGNEDEHRPDAFLWCARWRPLLCSWLTWLRDDWKLIGRRATIYTTGWRAHCWFRKQEARSPTLLVNHWARMRMELQPRLRGLRRHCLRVLRTRALKPWR